MLRVAGTAFIDWDEVDFSVGQRALNHRADALRRRRAVGASRASAAERSSVLDPADAVGLGAGGYLLKPGDSVGVKVGWSGHGAVGRVSGHLLVWCHSPESQAPALVAGADGSATDPPRFKFRVDAVMQVRGGAWEWGVPGTGV